MVADAADVVAADCETVERPAGPNDGGKPNDGGTPNDGGKPNDSGTVKLSVKLASQTRLKGALAKGLRVAVVGAKPAAKVKVTLSSAPPPPASSGSRRASGPSPWRPARRRPRAPARRRCGRRSPELTPHELRVAAQLYVTPKTVEHHLSRVYRKLGIRSRTELTRLLMAET